MKVNYVLMYGTPYLKYREFETFEDVSKFLVNKRIVYYSMFKKLEDKEEVGMIYRDNDIHYLEDFVKKQDQKLQQRDNIIKEVRELVEKEKEISNMNKPVVFYKYEKSILEILDKVKESE